MDMREKEDGELFEIVTCPSDYTKEEVAEAARELERRGYTVYKTTATRSEESDE